MVRGAEKGLQSFFFRHQRKIGDGTQSLTFLDRRCVVDEFTVHHRQSLQDRGFLQQWRFCFISEELQKATSLQPANWQDTGAPSPFTVPLGGPGEFYRVVPAL